MSYLFKPNAHVCVCPHGRGGPDNPRERQTTFDEPGTIWQCDECGGVWEVSVVVGSWNAYHRVKGRRGRALARAVSDQGGTDG